MKKLIVLLLAAFMVSSALADATSWLSTRYRKDVWSTGSWFRSPVTDGHLDVRVHVNHATFTDFIFTVNYDAAIVNTLSQHNVLEVAEGLSLQSVTNENLAETWKKATITLTGFLSIGSTQYESESIIRFRFVPHSEGVMPLTLWPENYPESYNTCSLTLLNNDVEVQHGPKAFNDGTTLFTFTDKSSRLSFHFDMNFGYPLLGDLKIVYDDDTVEYFYESDEARNISFYPEYSIWIIDPQPGAVSYTVSIYGYYDYGITFNLGYGSSHAQPSNHFFLKEKYEGFYGLKAGEDDIIMTIEFPGLGEDFEQSEYSARIAEIETGEIEKTFTFEPIDDDTIQVTLEGGLEPSYNYDMYIFKDGLIVGRTWFSASQFYPTTFTVTDADENPLEGALIRFLVWGMDITLIDEITDDSGKATIDLPGSPEWGSYHDYNVIFPGYDSVSDYVEVYDEPVDVDVVMFKAAGVNAQDFASFAKYWNDQDCFWSDCSEADMNFDGVIDIEDLILFAARWLQAAE